MVEGFHDIRFPTNISLGSRGGPERRTQIVSLTSGHERRVAQWAASRRRYNAGYGIRCGADIDAVIAFFEAREGRRYAFRWRDPFDFQSAPTGTGVSMTDQPLGVGDGTTTTFALHKTYASGGISHDRPITLPVAGTVLVAQDGAAVLPPAISIDHGTGLVAFAIPPAQGAVLTAGFAFDVPVRFDTDVLEVSLEPGGGTIPQIPLVEVRS